jgi:hypothetical protein
VNGSQSKFLEGTRPISQNQPNVPLFQLGEGRLALGKLSALGTGIGTIAETQNGASKTTSEIDDEIGSKNSLCPHRHFTEHLVGVFRKSLRECDLNRESLSLLIR